MSIQHDIVQAALLDEGQTEKRGNHGWVDKDFDMLMKTTGWLDGQAWCSYWAEKIWRQIYSKKNPELEKVIARLFSANAVQTYNNFFDSVFPTSDEPMDGAVVIWQKMTGGNPSFVGDTQWIRGHAGLVINTEGDASKFTTLEGNSNSEGGREGIEVARQERSLDFDNDNGLRLLGFIYPLAEV